MISLNHMAGKALKTAIKRGKVTDKTTDWKQIVAISGELNELADATEKRSAHIPFTEQEEEAADVIIATLTFLARKGVDVDMLLIAKMSYNANRED